jgi:hypothetical protein
MKEQKKLQRNSLTIFFEGPGCRREQTRFDRMFMLQGIFSNGSKVFYMMTQYLCSHQLFPPLQYKEPERTESSRNSASMIHNVEKWFINDSNLLGQWGREKTVDYLSLCMQQKALIENKKHQTHFRAIGK